MSALNHKRREELAKQLGVGNFAVNTVTGEVRLLIEDPFGANLNEMLGSDTVPAPGAITKPSLK